jgi:hypothetical protein
LATKFQLAIDLLGGPVTEFGLDGRIQCKLGCNCLSQHCWKCRVFRQSNLGQSLTPGIDMPRKIPAGTYLIGNAGYPSNVDILVPYPSVVNPANEWFNFIQSSTRICVEQAFGRLKNQFHILLCAQNANPFGARNTTFACMILHNILNQHGTLYLQVWDERGISESGYAEVPQTVDPADVQVSSAPSNGVSMWTRPLQTFVISPKEKTTF